MRWVLDANVIVAAMRSPGGVSADCYGLRGRCEITLRANVALALDYEATCRGIEHKLAADMTED